MRKIFLTIILFTSLFAAFGNSQTKKELRFAISYVASSVVYIDAGRERRIEVGDTLKIYNAGKEIGSVAVTAVSRRSSAAQIVSQKSPFSVGNEAVIVKEIVETIAGNEQAKTDTAASVKRDSSGASMKIPAVVIVQSTENIVSGRVGVQYNSITAENSRFNVSQPSTVLRLDVQNLFGTGVMLSFYDRSYYESKQAYAMYGSSSGLNHRIYEFTVQRDVAGSDYGYGFGRMTSRYVGGMGTFDGFQMFYRYDNFTAGVLGGAQVSNRSLSVNTNDTKASFFLNYRQGIDFFHQFDGTIAYGRQMVSSRLDREFIYLQNSLSLGPELSLYESTELELNDITNGVRTGALRLSNTFFTVNYYPVQWLTTSIGYDASRSVYLFESMKTISDTLIDKKILQGFRGSVTFRLPYFITLSTNGTYRTRSGNTRDAYNLGTSLRMSDILNSDVNAGVRYARIVGEFSEGNNYTVDFDRTFFYALSVSLRYDYYQYTIVSLKQTYTTQTATANLYYRLSKMWYTSLSMDGVFDTTMNSYRVFAEIGMRF